MKKLHEILDADFHDEHKFSNAEYMKLFTLVYNMCTQKPPNNYSEQLYTRYGTVIRDYLKGSVLQKIREQSDQYMLKEVSRRWEHHKINVKWMKSFFSYLDRFHTKRQSLPNMREVGMVCFKEVVHEETKLDVRTAVLTIVTQERDGEHVDQGLLKSVIEIYVVMGMQELDVYVDDFETSFLDDTSAFYARKASDWVQQDGLPDYLMKAERALEVEKSRVANYLHNSTEEKLLKVVNKELLEVHQDQLMRKEGTGLESLMIDEKKDELCRLYQLYFRLPTGLMSGEKGRYGLVAVGAMVKEHISKVGTELVRGQVGKREAGDEFVNELIALHHKYHSLVQECFSGNPIFSKALKEAHEKFINMDLEKSSMAQLLADYLDNLLKKGGKEKLDDSIIEERLERVVQLFSYLQDKDLFSEYYRKGLAKRLLHDKSASDEAERSLIAKLKMRCGQQFTAKLDGMITDLALASEHKSNYEDFKKRDAESEGVTDISVTVLTTGHWPSYKVDEMLPPDGMMQSLESFKRFYDTQKKRTKLTWLNTLGTAQVDAVFPSGKKKLEVSTYQACVLLQFNESDTIAFSELRERLNLPADELKRYLVSLACGKHKVLTKSNKSSPEVADDEMFTFNAKFKDKKAKLRFPLIRTDAAKAKEQKETDGAVDEDRKHAIEAAVVRIMKMRKVMKHQQLVMEVISQLHTLFKPEPKMIRKRIEDLIVREYLERDKDDMQTFRYLA